MSDANAFAFGKFIPGFEFLQQLASAQKAGGAMPGLGQWVAPTVSVDELDKRISELRAVLFWLDQNAAALKATIQALEVQKMTLATLQGMNVSMSEVAKAFTAPVTTPAAPERAPVAAAPTAAPAPGGTAPSWPFDQPTAEPATPATPPTPEPVADSVPEAVPAPAGHTDSDSGAPAEEAKATAPDAAASASAAARMADGMQWWNALTQQFQQIAASALRDAVPPKSKADAAAGAGKPTQTAAPKAARPKAAGKKRAAPKSVPQPASARKAVVKRAEAKKGATAQPTASRKAPARKAAPARAAAPAREAGGWPLPPPAKRR